MKKKTGFFRPGMVLAALGLWIIFSSMFKEPVESKYERQERIVNELNDYLAEEKGKTITWYEVHGSNDGTINIELHAYRKFNGGSIIQLTKLDNCGQELETITYHGNNIALYPIIDFSQIIEGGKVYRPSSFCLANKTVYIIETMFQFTLYLKEKTYGT